MQLSVMPVSVEVDDNLEIGDTVTVTLNVKITSMNVSVVMGAEGAGNTTTKSASGTVAETPTVA